MIKIKKVILSILLILMVPVTLQAKVPETYKKVKVHFLGEIVFQNNVFNGGIYKVNGDSLVEKQLSTEGKSFYKVNLAPKWAPDGKNIVFLNTNYKHYNLNIINPDGTARRKLLKDDDGFISLTSIRWSNNSNEVVYIWRPKRDTKRRGGWKAINIKTLKIRDAGPPIEEDPELWSHNKRYYAEAIPFTDDIEIGTASGVIKTINCGNLSGPQLYAWSPDNKYILYCKYCGYEGKQEELEILDVHSGKTYFVAYGRYADWYFQANKKLQAIAINYQSKTYDGDIRLYDKGDLKTIIGFHDYEKSQLFTKAFRNEIFARHGRQFKSENLQYIFGMSHWYKPNPNYSDKMLNDIEKKNIQFILDYEKKMGWR